MKIIKSETAKEAVEVGRRNRKTFRPLQGRGILDAPVHREEWWFVPIAQDTSVIPQEALRRVELLQNEGIAIKDMIVAHEAPLALMAPKIDRQIKRQKAEIGVGLLTIASFALLAFGYLLTATASVALIDPCLIVVLEDGTWIEVCAWDESFG